MIGPSGLPQRDVVLLGVGHTNAHVLRMWRMRALPDTRLTCVSNFGTATYSGMLPGLLAGQYSVERMQIDLVRLCSAAGARLVLGHVTGLDREARTVLFDDRVPVPYDVLSVGIGSIPSRPDVDGQDRLVVAIKPMQTFRARLEERLDEVLRSGPAVVRVAIVGGGAGGVEVAFCLPVWLRAILGDMPFELTLVSAGEQLVGGISEKTARLARCELQSRDVRVLVGRRVTRFDAGVLTLDSGDECPADVVIWATEAVGPPLLHRFGLPLDERGFIQTRPTLQSVADEAVFAVGDSGTLLGQRTPKAGVYAVRQGPILWENLGRRLRGEPLVDYRPQQGFLKLLNTGDGRAIGEYRGFTLSGDWVWRLKHRIDSRFMDMYQDYTPMAAESAGGEPGTGWIARLAGRVRRSGAPRGDHAKSVPRSGRMRCAGCGGKVSGAVLSRVLSRLDIPPHEHVLVGLDQPDDAAVIVPPPGNALNVTVDFFVAPFDDPFVVGRIAALNAASDCFATGARPLAALAAVTLPEGPPRQQEQMLYEILAGSLHEFRPMGATLAGGHTIEGSPLTVGFSMVAAQPGPPRTKGQLRVGDQLILTKPLGVGLLLAAHGQARCRAEWWEPLLHTMLLSNQYATRLCEERDLPGLTDITGFGLAGHLLEMLRPSGVAATLSLAQLPLLPGVDVLVQEGIESTLAPANRLVESEVEVAESLRGLPSYAALFDPQTSGGLLVGVPPDQAPAFLAQLRQQSAVPAALIGVVTSAVPSARRLRVLA